MFGFGFFGGGLKKIELFGSPGNSKEVGSEFRAGLIESVSADADVKKLANLLGENAFSAHSASEFGDIQTAVSERSDPVENFLFLKGKMLFEPVFEKGSDGVGEADDGEGGGSCTGCCCGFCDRGDFVIGEAGNDRGDHDIYRNSRFGESSDRAEAKIGSARSGFEDCGQLRIESCDGDIYRGELFGGHFFEEIEVACDQVVFCDEGDWIFEVGENFEAVSGNFEFSLDRLIRIGDAAHDERLRDPFFCGEFLFEQIRGISFDHDFRFEIESG